MKYMLIAGEASGDLHASRLITALRGFDADAEFRFFGGDLMAKAAGRRPDLHYDMMNVMGFSEVIRKFPQILRNLRAAKRLVREFRPDVLILIDYPSFNLKLAKYAHNLGITVDWYISPKVWAWKEYRVKKIKKYVSRLFSILPFEMQFYQEHGYKVRYVGNPSVEEMDYAIGHLPPRRHFIERQGLDATGDRPIIALLPGSRRGEIRNNLPLMIAAAKQFPEFQYVVGAAPAVPEKFYREVAQDPGLPVVFGCTPTLLKYSQAALVTSGTATLEAALIGTPQVVCYRANGRRISYKIMEKLLKVKYVSLPNLIVGNNVVPELLVHQCTAPAIARELSPLLQPSPKRDWQLAGYKNMRRRLGTSIAAEYAAELIYDQLNPVEEPADTPESEGEGKSSRGRRRGQHRRRSNGDDNNKTPDQKQDQNSSDHKKQEQTPDRNQRQKQTGRPRKQQENPKNKTQKPQEKTKEATDMTPKPQPKAQKKAQTPDRPAPDKVNGNNGEADTAKAPARRRRYRRRPKSPDSSDNS